ncbi:MarR family transcriptional regulator [Altererythrobacter endophyticus]|uniref:MarR family transcriptional regulator n=1 Tax=Altericroceibacterium endophyticum TaxID=1808508 RepID=A0A6I4T5K8_9SPHN|nr:MarR family transcriptional regulator [Altericroceibacterium endophyticum]
MAKGNPLALDRQICFPVYVAGNSLVRAYRPLLSEIGLTYPQYLVMLILWSEEAPLSVGTIGSHLMLDSGTLTPLLKRMESAGIVERRRDQADERRVLIGLTAKGRALRKDAESIPGKLIGCSGMSPTDLHDLHQAVITLRRLFLNDAPPATAAEEEALSE